jgi:hypothetical protein
LPILVSQENAKPMYSCVHTPAAKQEVAWHVWQ